MSTSLSATHSTIYNEGKPEEHSVTMKLLAVHLAILGTVILTVVVADDINPAEGMIN